MLYAELPACGPPGATIRYAFIRALSLLVVVALLALPPLAAQPRRGNTKERRILNREEPEYPAALKRLNIGGIVRVEVAIAPNGKVRTTTLLGGSPYLGQAAMKAIKDWKYAPAASDETVTVIIEFDPHR